MKSLSTIGAVALLVVSIATALPAQAATVTFDLVQRGALRNVDDPEGRWQFDGGDVYLSGQHVGYYIRKKRVSFAVPSSVNKAEVQTTVIWRWGQYSFTTQGTHYFGKDSQVGGVSAASLGFAGFDGAPYSGWLITTTQLTMVTETRISRAKCMTFAFDGRGPNIHHPCSLQG